MNDLISKRKILKWLEIQIAEYSRELKRELFAEDLVIVSERLDALKKVYDNIKDIAPLQFTDSADRAEDYPKREIETATKNNRLTIRLNLARAEIESLRKQYNEALKAQSKQKWISCEERLPDNSDYCLVIYSDYDIYTDDYSGKKHCMVLNYMPQYRIWNIKAPIKVYYWMPLPEFPNEDKEQDK